MKAGHIHMGKLTGGKGDKATPAYDGRLVRRIWTFVRPHRRLLFTALVLLPLSAAFNLAQPFIMKQAIDLAIVPRDLGLLPMLAGGLVLAILLERMAQFSETLLMQLCGQRAMHDLRITAHRHLLSLRSAYFDRTPVGRLMTRVTNDVQSINEAFAMGLVSVVGDIITLVGIIGVMFWLSPRMALVALSVVPVLLLVTEVFRRLLRVTHRVIRQRIAQINGALEEHITGMNVVQIFGQQRRAMGAFDEANRAHRDAYHNAIRYDASLFSLVEMLGSVTVALLLWYGGVRVVDGAVTFGLLVAFVEYVQRFFIPIRDLSAKYTVMQQAMAASERVFELLDTDEPEVAAASPQSLAKRGEEGGSPALQTKASHDHESAHIRFDDVRFAYTKGQPVLHGVSLSVEDGQRLAVVGPTGSGKSTLIRLLTRLYEVDGGRILLNGKDLRGIAPEELRRRLVVVSQDVFMFAGTVAQNISLDDPDMDPARVEEAAREVGLDRLLTLDHEVLERGANLSAGERQLIAFARALARDPEVLVLDEATASVDPETERVVQRGVARLLAGRTSIVIAHRLSTIQEADRILVLNRGKVTEEGTHEQLLEAGGLYKQLHELQYV